MIASFFVLLVGFQIKHFIADFLAQPDWMLQGKGSLAAVGGYVHAGIHAACSALVLLIAGVPTWVLVALVVAELVVHYALDFAKAHYSAGVDEVARPARYWAMFGLDQLLHQLTYVAMIYLALLSLSGGLP
jgi:hypothetical protein